MAQLMFPDIVGQYRQGQQYGQQQQANKLAGDVYGVSPQDRQPLLSQLAALNPQMAVGLGNSLASQDAAQAQRDQAVQDRRNKIANTTAQAMLAAYKSGDPQRIEGTYQAVRSVLSGHDPQSAASLPANWSPDLLPTLYKIVGETGGMPDQKGTVVAPGGVLVDSQTGRQMFSNPAKPANMQVITVPDGQGGTFQALLDPTTGQVHRPNYGGMQSSSLTTPSGLPMRPDGMAPAIQEANRRVAAGENPDKVESWLESQPGVTIDQGGQIGYSPSKDVRTLTADEVKQYGLPNGTVAQVDPTGKINVVSKPPQMSAAQEAIQAVKAQKATEAQQAAVQGIDDNIQQIDQLLKAPGFGGLATFTGDTLGRIPHTDTANARAMLDTIGNQSLLSTLSNLKSLSSTGASGFGALSDSEGRTLRNAAVNLGESQSNPQLRQNLIDYRNKLQRTRDRIASAQVKFDQPQEVSQQSTPAAAARPRATNPQTGQTVEWDGQNWTPING